MANSIASDVIINNGSQNLKRIIFDKIMDIKVHNKIKRDEPSVRIARRAYIISALSLVFSIIIGIVTFYFTFINK